MTTAVEAAREAVVSTDARPAPEPCAGRRRLVCGTGLALLGAGQVVPARAATATAGGPPRVVASFSILADLVRQVLPPEADVHALVGADTDAHVFSPRPADAQRVAQADWVVVNGLGFEGWLDRLVRSSGYRGTVLTVTDRLTPRRQGRGADPHVWHSPALLQAMVQRIAEAAAVRWPLWADSLSARAAAYRQQIQALDGRLRAELDAVPRADRRVITAHDAFGYLGEAYGIDFLSPQGWSTHAAPSAAAVGRLIRQIREQRVKAVFLENISDPRLMQRIADEAGARVGGTLYSDALSRPGGPASSVLALLEHNVTSIRNALA
jgi:zinc/manganese transport system substrate-binding protein